MEIIENFLVNGTELTFSVLFIAMLLYVIKTNDTREQRYQQTIDTLTSALNGYQDLKDDVTFIKNKLG